MAARDPSGAKEDSRGYLDCGCLRNLHGLSARSRYKWLRLKLEVRRGNGLTAAEKAHSFARDCRQQL
jgi:hypothetical protein